NYFLFYLSYTPLLLCSFLSMTRPAPISTLFPYTTLFRSNPHELTVLEIARKVQDLAGTHVPLEFKPLPADDPKVRCPDIQCAKELLGWEPKISLEEGLRRTIEYFRKKLG